MKKITVSIVTMLASLALTSSLYAAGEYKGSAKTEAGSSQSGSAQQPGMSGSSLGKASQSQTQSAEEILGMSVVSQDGEDIGEIQDIKIDTRTGRINYVTIQKGGVMGIGGQEGIAVPLEAFQFTKENAKLTVDKTKLDNAPKPANMSDQEFRRGLESHYGISPAWQEGRGTPSQMNMNPAQPEGSQQMQMDPSKPQKSQQ